MAIYDADAGGLGDYSEIQDAVDAIPATLLEHYTINYRSSDGSIFSTLCNIDKTMNGFSILVQAVSGDEALKSDWDDTRARLVADTTGSVFTVSCENVTVDGLQISNTNAVGTSAYCYRLDGTATNVKITNTRMTLPNGNADGLLAIGTVGNLFLENFIIECLGIVGSGSEGIISFNANLKATNGVVNKFNDGLEQESGTFTAVNVAVLNCGTSFDAVSVIDYCISPEGSGTNERILSTGGLSEFVDPSPNDPGLGETLPGDYTAIEGSNLQFGVGPTSNPDVPTTDIEGDTRSGAASYMGVDEPSALSPTDFIGGVEQTQVIGGALTIEASFTEFSYAQINAGFSGFFNFVDDSNERKFGANALWLGTITGTEATLKCEAGTAPYVVYVDGVVSRPVRTAGEIVLFTGLADVTHDVTFVAHPVGIDLFNAININGLDTLVVTGAVPAMTPFSTEYVSDTDTPFLGLNSYSTKVRPNLDLTPTYEEVSPWDYERGQIIFEATCDEIWIYTDDTGVLFSVDGATPTEVLFSETNIAPDTSAVIRRAVKVSDSLDDTTKHQYAIWGVTDVNFGIQGVLAKKDGVAVTVEAVTDAFIKTVILGSSVVAGSVGSIEGYSDSWIFARTLKLLMTKAGKGGNTTQDTIDDLPNILAANGVPQVAIFGASTNDNGDPLIQGKYETLIEALLLAGSDKVICRGVVPYNSTLNDALKAAIIAVGDSRVYYVESELFVPMETYEGTHPTILGYSNDQLAGYETPYFRIIIYGTSFTGGVVQLQEIGGVLTIVSPPSENPPIISGMNGGFADMNGGFS